MAEPSEASTAQKKRAPAQECAAALLELFELLVAQASEEHVAELEQYADEWKPRLERLLRGLR